MFQKSIPALRYTATVVLMAVAIGGWFATALSYQYNHLLFLSSFDYVAQTFSMPGGTAQYIAASWAEMCSAPWAGAIISGVLLCLGGAALGVMARGAEDRWSLGYVAPWIVAAGICLPDFFGAAATWLLVVGLVALWFRLKSRPKLAWVVVGLAYFAGGGLAMGLAVGLVCVRLWIDRSAWLWIALAAGAGVLSPLVATFVYEISIGAAYTSGAEFSWWAVGFSVATIVVGNWAPGRTKAKAWWGWAAFGVVSIIGAMGLSSHDNQRILAIMRIEYAMLDKQWPDVEQQANAFTERWGSDRVVTFLHNTSLARQGKLLDRLFEQRQAYGAQGLLFAQSERAAHNPHLGAKLYTEHYYSTGYDFEQISDLHQIVIQNTLNHSALEYLTALYLLSNQTDSLQVLADRWVARHSKSSIPEVVQQALLAIGHDFQPDEHVAAEYEQFLAEKASGATISAHLQDTYWFHAMQHQQERA